MEIAEAESAVSDIIGEVSGVQLHRLSSGSDLLSDLGIDGDDAVDVFRKLEVDLQVDFSLMQWDRHFGPEAGFNLFALLSPSWWRWRRHRIPVTVRDLVDCVVTRRWTASYLRDA